MVLVLYYIFFCIVAVDEESFAWNFYFIALAILSDFSMMVITFVSMRYINRYSKVIEKIGVKTDSKLMKVYLFCWSGLNFFYLIHIAITFIIAPDMEKVVYD